MRRIVVALPVLALVLVGWLAPRALAQDTKSARGTVTAMAGNAVTVKAGDREMKFTVDAKTVLTAEGAGTAARKAEAAGKTGPSLTDFVKVGDNVEVSYRESGGAMQATSIRKVAAAGGGGGGAGGGGQKTETASGTVETVTASSLTITGSGGGGSSFKQTYTIDATTRLVGSGAGTAAAAKGGKMVITDYLSKGDRVTVTYHQAGTSLHAAEIRVTGKGK